ncbi:hypothetical protein XU18_1019 [Perkinsela sp. CCAP 1560/4]|nr:hypothetical protein XU18_1019 [Perkinsela sp. CCAP 1560/4]|eukprot:KNH08450.1 hypothetical protein XU18_1019 [Perkinsela sp. CCAP 1560/4]
MDEALKILKLHLKPLPEQSTPAKGNAEGTNEELVIRAMYITQSRTPTTKRSKSAKPQKSYSAEQKVSHAYCHECRASYLAAQSSRNNTRNRNKPHSHCSIHQARRRSKRRRSDAISKRGRSSKKTELVTKSVDEILERFPCLSLSQIRTLMIDETLRPIVPAEEQSADSPLESDRY